MVTQAKKSGATWSRDGPDTTHHHLLAALPSCQWKKLFAPGQLCVSIDIWIPFNKLQRDRNSSRRVWENKPPFLNRLFHKFWMYWKLAQLSNTVIIDWKLLYSGSVSTKIQRFLPRLARLRRKTRVKVSPVMKRDWKERARDQVTRKDQRFVQVLQAAPGQANQDGQEF